MNHQKIATTDDKNKTQTENFKSISQILQNPKLRSDLIAGWVGSALNSFGKKIELKGGFSIYSHTKSTDRKVKPQTHKVYGQFGTIAESYCWLQALSDLLNGKPEVSIPFGSGLKLSRVGRGGKTIKATPGRKDDDKNEKKENNKEHKPTTYYFRYEDFALQLMNETQALLNTINTILSEIALKEDNENKNVKKNKKNKNKQQDDKKSDVRKLITKQMERDKLISLKSATEKLLENPGIPGVDFKHKFTKDHAHKAKVNKQAQVENQNITDFLLSAIPKSFMEKPTPVEEETAPSNPTKESQKHSDSNNQNNNTKSNTKQPKKQGTAKNNNQQENKEEVPDQQKPARNVPDKDGMITVVGKRKRPEGQENTTLKKTSRGQKSRRI